MADSSMLKLTAGLPFKWTWLLYDNVITNDPFDSLASYTALFVARTSPESKFSKQLTLKQSGAQVTEIVKVEPNRIDLVLLPATTALLQTGYYEVTLKHASDPSKDILVAHGPLVVTRRGVPA